MPFPRLNEGAALAEKFNKRTVSALLVARNLAVISVCVDLDRFICDGIAEVVIG